MLVAIPAMAPVGIRDVRWLEGRIAELVLPAVGESETLKLLNMGIYTSERAWDMFNSAGQLTCEK